VGGVDPGEERLLRLWLASLDGRIRMGSLFSRAMRTGVPLLMAADAIVPGCVDWPRAYLSPHTAKVHKILSVCNANQAVEIFRSVSMTACTALLLHCCTALLAR
jgi:hypothetical protein